MTPAQRRHLSGPHVADDRPIAWAVACIALVVLAVVGMAWALIPPGGRT